MDRSIKFYLILLSGLAALSTSSESKNQEGCPMKCDCYQAPTEDGTTVNCSNSGLKEFPTLSPMTKVLSMTKNNITLLNDNWIKKTFPNLRQLFLDHNDLRTEEVSSAQISKTLPNLLDLSLVHNKISNIPRNLPQSLTVLQLSMNQIESLFASDLSNLPNLEILYLDNNHITTIDERCFGLQSSPDSPPENLLQNLKSLHLSGNLISHISDYSFSTLTELRAISLADNKLRHFGVNTFKGLRNLQYLDASNNELITIQNQTFKHLSSLNTLYLNNNYLTEMPLGLPFLDWADLSWNRIKYVNETSSKRDIYPVEMLNLANNPLHCDCKMLWLKELWDRREYLLSDNIDSENFIPSCETPVSLRGELWTLLGDDVFVCKSTKYTLAKNSDSPKTTGDLDEHSHVPDVSVFEQNTENTISENLDASFDHLQGEEISTSVSPPRNSFIQDYNDENINTESARKQITLRAMSISENSVTIICDGDLHEVANGRHFFIRYHIFGQTHSPLFAQFNADVTQIQLHGLQAQTNYILCLVIPTTNSNLPGNVDLHNCIEITTKTSSILWHWMQINMIDDKTLDYYFKVLFCSFMASCIICGIGFLLFELCTKGIFTLKSGSKKHED